MALLSLFFALLIEQMQPLQVQRVKEPLQRFAAELAERFDRRQIAWWVLVATATLLTLMMSRLFYAIHPFFAFLFNIGVLYLCCGFGYEGRFFTDIDLALRMGQTDRARNLLSRWRGGDYHQAGAHEIARLAIEQALIAAHRNVFGLGAWFVVFGPAGAVLYRLAALLADGWGEREREALLSPQYAEGFARRAFIVIDWVPQRLTAIAFSVMGNFEDGIYCWRAQARRWQAQAPQWRDKACAVLLAAGAGALGVRLGMPIREAGLLIDRPELGVGEKADINHMQGTVGLVWRALILCLLVLLLITAAGWVGN